MTLPIKTLLLENMQMIFVIELEIMSPWNAILAAITIDGMGIGR